MQKKKYTIIFIIAFACLLMGIIDAFLMPGYMIKSIAKITLFLTLAIGYFIISQDLSSLKSIFTPNKKGLFLSVAAGLSLLFLLLGSFFICKNLFDLQQFASTIRESAGVNKDNFLAVTVYICLINSFLEEFFFRGFAFLTLRKVSSRKTAYLVSATFFSLYHAAMMVGSSIVLVALSLLGLFIGGLIFNFINERYDNIYMSWIVHLCANVALNMIGYILM